MCDWSDKHYVCRKSLNSIRLDFKLNLVRDRPLFQGKGQTNWFEFNLDSVKHEKGFLGKIFFSSFTCEKREVQLDRHLFFFVSHFVAISGTPTSETII